MKSTAFLILIAMTASVMSDGLTLSVRADKWYPYNGEPAAVKSGYVVELLKAIFEPQHITIDYQVEPWSRSIEETRKGIRDSLLCANHPDAPDFIFPMEACGMETNVFYALRRKHWRYNGLASLENIKLGIVDNYCYSEELDAYIRKNKDNANRIVHLTGDDVLANGLEMMKKDRFDVLVDDESVIVSKINDLGLKSDDFQKVGIVGEPVPVYVAFSPKVKRSQQYADMWDVGMRDLRKSGSLRTILASYGLTDWNLPSKP